MEGEIPPWGACKGGRGHFLGSTAQWEKETKEQSQRQERSRRAPRGQ